MYGSGLKSNMCLDLNMNFRKSDPIQIHDSLIGFEFELWTGSGFDKLNPNLIEIY